MSTQGADSVSAALDAARLTAPAWVLGGSERLQREYALGLQFEKLLVQQLASSLTATAEPASESAGAEGEAGGTNAAASVLSSMIPGALADGVVAGGGLGLAAELTRQLESRAGEPGTSHGAPSGAGAALPAAGGVEADVTGGARA